MQWDWLRLRSRPGRGVPRPEVGGPAATARSTGSRGEPSPDLRETTTGTPPEPPDGGADPREDHDQQHDQMGLLDRWWELALHIQG